MTSIWLRQGRATVGPCRRGRCERSTQNLVMRNARAGVGASSTDGSDWSTMTNSNVSHPTPVIRGHPLLVAPVIVVAIWVRAVEGVAAAQLAFVVATGGVLVIEVTARLPVRAA